MENIKLPAQHATAVPQWHLESSVQSQSLRDRTTAGARRLYQDWNDCEVTCHLFTHLVGRGDAHSMPASVAITLNEAF